MIETRQGNALELQRGILVHGCNCQGVMGAGIAKFIREKWPDVFAAYKAHQARVGLRLGDVCVVGNCEMPLNDAIVKHAAYPSHNLPRELVVVNAMTQDNFHRRPGQPDVDYDAITACFARVRIIARDTGLPVHFPLIGCGLAGGKWEEVAPRIEAALGPDIEAVLWVLPS